MVKKFSFSLLLLLAIACSKKSSTPAEAVTTTPIIYIPSGSNMNAPLLLMDSTWVCTLVGYPTLRFNSNGIFNTGTWRIRQPDSIRAYTMFPQDWRIVKVTADTLKLVNVGLFVSVYHH